MSRPIPRYRWNGEAWVLRPGLVVHSRQFRSPELIAAEVARRIIDHKLTDVMMIGENVDGQSRSYIWMKPTRQLWYAHQLAFHGMHGRFSNQGSAHGECL